MVIRMRLQTLITRGRKSKKVKLRCVGVALKHGGVL